MNSTPTIEVVEFRATNYSPDGKHISVSLGTKHATKMNLAVPVTCLHDLIADLRRLQPSSSLQSDASSNQAAVPPTAAVDPNRVNVTVPKKWVLASGLPKHPLVIIVFDPQTTNQAGYALPEQAARDMAAGLIKYADALAQQLTANQKKN